VNVVFAGGSMGRLCACSQNICTVCKCFANKHGFFRPAGGESGRLSRHMPGLEPTAYLLSLNNPIRRREDRAPWLWTRTQAYHAAAGDSGSWVRHRTGAGCTG